MKQIIVVALVTIAAASVAVGQCAKMGKMTHGNAAVEAIKQLEAERNKALVAGDLAAVDRLYSDDYTSAVGNSYRTKAEVLADLKSGVLKIDASSNDETNVRVFGNTAVVTGKSTVKRHDRGAEINGQVYFTRVWVKQMAHWRLVANHASSITQ
jgi:ketosteroid isomerase-like protein